MKKTITKVIILGLIAGSAQAYPGQSCSPHPQAELQVKAVALGAHQTVWYQDILNRCSGYVSDMARTRHQAAQYARTGQLNQAAKILAAKLEEKASQFPVYGDDQVYPHTVAAIKGGNKVVRALMASTAALSSQPEVKTTIGQVRYKTADKVFELIDNSYQYLDAPYFMTSVRTCYRGCDSFESLPSEYYQGLGSLAQDFINLQTAEARTMAFDSVELAVAGEVVGAAKDILLSSVYRREYACVITQLHNLEWDIKSQTQCGGILPNYQFVDQIRAEIESLEIPSMSCGYDRTAYSRY